jgi:hypothetical protein
VRVSHGALEVLFFDLPTFALASLSVALFYVASQVEQGRGTWQSLKHLPAVMALGIGLSVNQARAVVEALMGYETGFVRTPKLGDAAQKKGAGAAAKKRYKGLVNFQPVVELGLAAYMTYGVMFLIERKEYWSVPFLVLFQVGSPASTRACAAPWSAGPARSRRPPPSSTWTSRWRCSARRASCSPWPRSRAKGCPRSGSAPAASCSTRAGASST